MTTLKRFAYKSASQVSCKQAYSTVRTDVYQVGYNLKYRLGEVSSTETLYFASKKQQAAATLACMQRHKNCVVQSVNYA
jgi:hypothetical protein